jgi:hypothetical protein
MFPGDADTEPRAIGMPGEPVITSLTRYDPAGTGQKINPGEVGLPEIALPPIIWHQAEGTSTVTLKVSTQLAPLFNKTEAEYVEGPPITFAVMSVISEPVTGFGEKPAMSVFPGTGLKVVLCTPEGTLDETGPKGLVSPTPFRATSG